MNSIDNIINNVVYGSCLIPKSSGWNVVLFYKNSKPVIGSIDIENAIDSNGAFLCKFIIDCSSYDEDIFNYLTDIKVILTNNVESITIPFAKHLNLANDLHNLKHENLKFFKNALNSNEINMFIEPIRYSKGVENIQPQGSIVVIAYANDSTAWFPYFYSYYSNLVGCENIHIITTAKDSFLNYELGGLVVLPDRSFDDRSIASLLSGYANAMRAYYEWTIVCDVDEIIIPNPLSNLNFHQILATNKDNVLIGRGFDIVQTKEDKEFDFSKDILSQRNVMVPNLALSKPAISRVNITYCSGFHYCNHLTSFNDLDTSFLTLHLKYACTKIRGEVLEIVNRITYAEKHIGEYCVKSVQSKYHPYIEDEKIPSFAFKSDEVKNFFAGYSIKLKYDNFNKYFVGSLEPAQFLVKFQ